MGNEAEMSKYLNKILKNKAKKDIGTLKKGNGEYTTPGIVSEKTLPYPHREKGNCLSRCFNNQRRTSHKI